MSVSKKNILSKEQLNHIEKQIEAIEQKTEAELVVMIVSKSSALGSARLLIGFLLGLGISTMPLFSQFNIFSDPYILRGILFLVFFALGYHLKINWLMRLVIPDQDEIDQVWSRAQLEFYQHQLHETQKKSGILIFVSLLEQRVVVFGDSKISSKISENFWDETILKIISVIKKQGLYEGVNLGVQACGDLLIQNFPNSSSITQSPNELSNTVIIKN